MILHVSKIYFMIDSMHHFFSITHGFFKILSSQYASHLFFHVFLLGKYLLKAICSACDIGKHNKFLFLSFFFISFYYFFAKKKNNCMPWIKLPLMEILSPKFPRKSFLWASLYMTYLFYLPRYIQKRLFNRGLQ